MKVTNQKRPVLKLGSQGKRVAALETKLKKLGHLEGKVDNKFDKRTAEAVLDYKREKGWNLKAMVGERMSSALKLPGSNPDVDLEGPGGPKGPKGPKGDDGDSTRGTETPTKMRGGTYNVRIGRNPQVAKHTVAKILKDNKLDFLQLQEMSGYTKELRSIPGYKLFTFKGAKDRGETGVLVKNSIVAKDPKLAEAKDGWITTRGTYSQPRGSASVEIAGWLRVASVHAPPGIDWVNGRPQGADRRVESYQSLTQELLKLAKSEQRKGNAMLIGGDWNEGAATGGPGSPSWLAARAGMRKYANHSIDWEMARGAIVENQRKLGEYGSDHNLRIFTVRKAGK